jgi:hypothetical protein
VIREAHFFCDWPWEANLRYSQAYAQSSEQGPSAGLSVTAPFPVLWKVSGANEMQVRQAARQSSLHAPPSKSPLHTAGSACLVRDFNSLQHVQSDLLSVWTEGEQFVEQAYRREDTISVEHMEPRGGRLGRSPLPLSCVSL